ncbi:hypothetical protein, partial [Streptomyces sp. R11]|uniref:hypothetical protein n=1 Tax=Streptomyces sp. R11 TaxID=3238625 RepID=UPI0034DEA4D3
QPEQEQAEQAEQEQEERPELPRDTREQEAPQNSKPHRQPEAVGSHSVGLLPKFTCHMLQE